MSPRQELQLLRNENERLRCALENIADGHVKPGGHGVIQSIQTHAANVLAFCKRLRQGTVQTNGQSESNNDPHPHDILNEQPGDLL
jgi:hypothetical protein